MLRILTALLVSFVALSSTHAASIRVRTECGFFYAVCGEAITLEQNGAPYVYEARGDTWPVSFSLAYVDDAFVMTALSDYVIHGGHSAHGWSVYPGAGPMVPHPESLRTAYGFIFFHSFPQGVGATRTIAIPPAAADVPEPGTALLLLGGLAALGWGRRRAAAVTA